MGCVFQIDDGVLQALPKRKRGVACYVFENGFCSTTRKTHSVERFCQVDNAMVEPNFGFRCLLRKLLSDLDARFAGVFARTLNLANHARTYVRILASFTLFR
jgi:hypothetical protein